MIHERREYEYEVDVGDEPHRGERSEHHERGDDPYAEHREQRAYERQAYRARARDGRPISHIVRDLRDEATLLMRQQVELLKAEMTAKASKWTRNAVYIAVGGFIAYAGFIFLLLAATAGVLFALIEAGVAQMHALWLAPLIVGLIVAIVGYIFVQKGISTLKRASAMPKRTARTLREDKQWLQSKAHTRAK
jgi:hypothetical protein